MGRLEVSSSLQQAVEFAVGNLRFRLDVIQVVVMIDQTTQFGGFDARGLAYDTHLYWGMVG